MYVAFCVCVVLDMFALLLVFGLGICLRCVCFVCVVAAVSVGCVMLFCCDVCFL